MKRALRVCAAALLALLLGATAPTQAQTAAPACPPLPSVDNRPPRDRGLLWKLTRDGRVSYLYGTLHVGRPGWERFGPATSAALAAADALALEVDTSDPGKLHELAEESAARAKREPELSPALAARLARATARACLPPGAMSGAPPVFQAGLLSLLELRWLGVGAEYAQEALLAADARKAGRHVYSLETVAQQVAALLPPATEGAAAAGAAALIAGTLDQLEDGSARRVLTKLLDAWVAGDLATLERYDDWCECAGDATNQALMQRLNDARNPALADGIAALHGPGPRGMSIFAAVGAMHMTGANALPRLLAERGFVVERVAFAR